MTGFDPLWVPLIAHYHGNGRIDADRSAAHLASLEPHVCQYLVAGTTGDGWNMSDAALRDWLDVVTTALGDHQSYLVGAFGATTDAVLARAQMIERHIAKRAGRGRFAGLTVCAPVLPDAEQEVIAAHFERIFAATTAPIAIYQLPQVTQCSIALGTFEQLERNPRFVMWKDTSGEDVVAQSAGPTSVRLVRGAEGDYADHLKPGGRYDGWLLSTANGFAPTLRAIADATERGDLTAAKADSVALSVIVAALFEAAGRLGGNAFADANRAVDHWMAHGVGASTLPLRCDGSRLPSDFIAFAHSTLGGRVPEHGYLRG